MPELQQVTGGKAKMNTPELVNHLERHLGNIQRGWGPEERAGLQVALFSDTPSAGLATLVSLGLSNHVLQMTGERTVRQELLLVAGKYAPLEQLAALLLNVTETVLNTHQALLRGHVLALAAPVTPGSSLTHLYVCVPFFLSEEARTFHLSSPPTIFAWLMPITQAEASYIEKSGWSAFEDKLEELGEEMDLFDLERSSVPIEHA